MKESYSEVLARHAGPETYAGGGNAAGVATASTLAELSDAFGLGHPDSAANLVRSGKQQESKSSAYRNRLKQVEQAMAKTENQV